MELGTRKNSNSTASEIISIKVHKYDELVEQIGNEINYEYGSKPSVVNDLKSLSIKSNRGRSRKLAPKKVNKFFKVPLNRKSLK